MQHSKDYQRAVLDAALRCQMLQLAEKQETDAAALQQLHRDREDATKHLYDLLHPALLQIARAWMPSGMANDPETLALSAMGTIYMELPKLKLDPKGNVAAYLCQIARYGLSDRNAKDKGGRARQSGGGDVSLDPDRHAQVSFDEDERWLRKIMEQSCLSAIFSFWKEALSPDDYQLMSMRLNGRMFEAIAEHMGQKCTVAALRQRHSRIIKQTRAHLQKLGLIDNDNDA